MTNEEDALVDQLFTGELLDKSLCSKSDDEEKATTQNITQEPTGILPDLIVIQTERKLVAEVEVNPKSWIDILDGFHSLIEQFPFYASLYNNRAQLLRLMGRRQEALEDLDAVIAIGSRQLCPSLNDKELRYVHSTLQKAHLQRAAIHRALKKELLTEIEANEIEEKIRQDLEMAGLYGHEKARKMAVQLNPYAKLCSQMVKQMMSSENNKNSE